MRPALPTPRGPHTRGKAPPPAPPHLRPTLSAPSVPRPGSGRLAGPRDVARSWARPHHVQQRQHVRTQGWRGPAGREPFGGSAGPGLPPHPWGPAESGADGKRGGAARPGSPGVAQEGRDPGPGGGAPGGTRRSIAPRTGFGGAKVKLEEVFLPESWLCSPRRLGTQPLSQALAPGDPSPGSRALPATLLRSLTRFPIETAGRSSFRSPSSPGRAASNPSRGGGRVAQAAALRQRNPTSSPARPPLSSEPSAHGSALCAHSRPWKAVLRSRVPGWGKRIGIPGQPSWAPALSSPKGCPDLRGPWKADDQ